MDFSDSIVVYDVKVGRCSHLNECMNLHEYQRSRSFIDLYPWSLRFYNFKLLFLKNKKKKKKKKNTGPIEAKFHVEPPWNGGMKICSNGPGHMTNMATMPIYGKNKSSLELKRPVTLKISENWSTTKFVQMMILGLP